MSGMPAELHDLMLRYCQLGRLLPQDEDMEVTFEDPRALGEVKIILEEMAKVKKRIDDFIAVAGARSPARTARAKCSP
jgi:hypothetical protein